MKNLLIIFVKNPVLGKVKSRLAQSIGAEGALSVYKKLLERTRETVVNLDIQKQVSYSDKLDETDLWGNDIFRKAVQKGENLGERMYHAIENGHKQSFQKICLIGSDIFELTEEIIKDAFKLLDHYDIVLGPSEDGGYYLIGMKTPVKKIFENKKWGTNSVLHETIKDIRRIGLKFELLPTLNDIDVLEDIKDVDRDFLLS